MLLKLKIYVIRNDVSIFGSHARTATKSNIINLIRLALHARQGDLHVKSEYGCPCQTERLADAIRRSGIAESVIQRGSILHLEIARSKRLPKFKAKRSTRKAA